MLKRQQAAPCRMGVTPGGCQLLTCGDVVVHNQQAHNNDAQPALCNTNKADVSFSSPQVLQLQSHQAQGKTATATER